MEKLVLDEGEHPHDYCTSKCPDRAFFPSVKDLGRGFITGTTIGLFYNFIKGNNSCGFKSRLLSALAKSPCLGGNLALLSLGCSLSRTAYFKYIGETQHEDFIPHDITCSAIAGAVAFSHHGLRPALLGALASTGLVTVTIMQRISETSYRASICKTNTYTYPYYHHPPRTSIINQLN